MNAVKLSSDVNLRAVAYLRKSTRDQQENSIFNQRQAIDAFAERHQIKIVKYLVDDGISGLTMEKRTAFKQLINEYVIGGKVDFQVILVLDVTRWGRFQDIDESAHLEYICRKHGKEIIYVTESFKNDNSIMDTVIKSIKRAMAAEYSKNLGDKVLAGSLTIAAQGYRVGGRPPYGFERMRLNQQRQSVGILKDGERKAIANERVALVPGQAEEASTVQDIFDMFTRMEMPEREIAVQLNQRKVSSPGGGRWTENAIRLILKHEIYTGANVYNRQTQRLHGPSRRNPRDRWVIVPGAYEALVSPEVFAQAQTIFQKRHPALTDQEIIEQLKQLLAAHGRLTGLIIESSSASFSPASVRRRFGTLINAYRLVGWEPPQDFRYLELKDLVMEYETNLTSQLIENLQKMGLKIDSQDAYFVINDQINVEVLASSVRNGRGRKRWAYRFDRRRSIDITIAVRLMDDQAERCDYFLFPMMAMEAERLLVAWTNGVSLDLFRFDSLDYFYDMFGDVSIINDKQEVGDAADSGTADRAD